MRRFFKVEMAVDGWGLLVNDGMADDPRFRAVMKDIEHYEERLAADLSRGDADTGKFVWERRRD